MVAVVNGVITNITNTSPLRAFRERRREREQVTRRTQRVFAPLPVANARDARVRGEDVQYVPPQCGARRDVRWEQRGQRRQGFVRRGWDVRFVVITLVGFVTDYTVFISVSILVCSD
jgi:hypothetical protein